MSNNKEVIKEMYIDEYLVVEQCLLMIDIDRNECNQYE